MSRKKSTRSRAVPPPEPASNRRTAPNDSPAAGGPSIGLPPWLLWLGFVALVLVVYYPAWHGAPLWDDDAHLTRPDLRSLHGLWRIWFDVGATQQYYPVAHSAFWIFFHLWGGQTFGYHLVNIVLHATSAFLVVLILRRLAIPGAALAGLIFAVHPVQVESVAWMTELKNTLSGVCYLGAALAYLRFRPSREPRWYWLALALFVTALLSKTVTATLPAALLVIVWWQRGRLDWRQDVRPLLPFFALGIGSGLLTAWVERAQIGAEGPMFQFTPIDRILIAGRAFWFYVAKLVWPANLTFIYPRWHVSQAQAWQYLYPLALVALVGGLWWYRTRSRAPLAAVLLFGGTLFPALGFFNVYPFIYSFVADHFQYLASLGLITLFAAGVATWAGRWPDRRAALVVIVALVVALPATVLTWRQSRLYTDPETLYRTTLARNPTCWMAYINLGKLRQQDAERHGGDPARLEEAMAMFKEAVRLEPRISQAHNNLGAVLFAMNRLDEAEAEYRQALQLRPGDPEVQYNLGLVLQRQGRTDEATTLIQAALRAKPGQAGGQLALGDSLLSAGRVEEAISAYTAALQASPDDAEVHNNLGSALARAGRLDEAIAQFEAALRINPRSARAGTNLGLALLRKGRGDDAVRRLGDAVSADPEFPGAHYGLATALEALGRHEEAIVEYRATLARQPDRAEVHNDLGIALAEVGRYQEAVAEFREAIRLKPDFEDAKANLQRALAMIKPPLSPPAA